MRKKVTVTEKIENVKEKRLLGLLISELREMLNAEQQIVKALPNMIKAADCPELRDAFKDHLDETKEQVTRLQQIFEIIDEKEFGEPCEAMHGLIQECMDTIELLPKSALRDAALIAKAQCIEHYELSIYGTMRTFAKELKLDEVVDLLQLNQNEEINADKKLSKIAEGGLLTAGVNRKANEEGF